MSNSLLTIQAITKEALRVLEDELVFGGSSLELDRFIMKAVEIKNNKAIGKRLAHMMNMEQSDLVLNNIWRLEITESGSYKINDFTLPSNEVIINKIHRKKDLPTWMLESLAVLQILNNGESISKVGKKIDSTIFYLVEPIKD
jgi:hypothetical protein